MGTNKKSNIIEVNGSYHLSFFDLNKTFLGDDETENVMDKLQSGDLLIIMNDKTIINLNMKILYYFTLCSIDVDYVFLSEEH